MDGQNMPALFHNTSDLLEEFTSMKDEPEDAEFSIDVDPELSSEVGQLSQIAETELACKNLSL
jgi:ubiquitin carboxyl-terminal hydrolase 25/28